nr:MAG TPA: hypothetical protein [Caudoviricetes sp.]
MRGFTLLFNLSVGRTQNTFKFDTNQISGSLLKPHD